MLLKIKGDCEKAKKAMGTNIELKEGQLLNGPEDKIKIMSQKYPDHFELVKEDGSSFEEKKEKKSEGFTKPRKDKKFKKGGRFKFS